MRGFSEYKTSAMVLIAANALPLFGVLFLGWDTFSIVALYWTENVIIGAINVLKMATCNPDLAAIYAFKFKESKTDGDLADKYASTARSAQIGNQLSKFFLIPFFIFHYGLFCLVHGVFVFAFFGHESFDNFGSLGSLSNIGQVFSEQRMWWCVVALAASHLCSFFVNYLGRGEYRRSIVIVLMAQPYARIIVLHVAIIIGGFISVALGSNIGILMIFIIGKTLLDLSLHLRERIKYEASETPSPILPDVITTGTAGSPAMPAASAQSRPPVHSSSDG